MSDKKKINVLCIIERVLNSFLIWSNTSLVYMYFFSAVPTIFINAFYSNTIIRYTEFISLISVSIVIEGTEYSITASKSVNS